MKLLPLLLLLLGSAVAADDAGLSGEWQVHNSISGNESDQTCTFVQKDNELSGNCNSDRGVVKITGKADGRKATWSFKSEHDGTPLTVAYDGNVTSAAKITGRVAVPEFGVEGEFTAVRSK